MSVFTLEQRKRSVRSLNPKFSCAVRSKNRFPNIGPQLVIAQDTWEGVDGMLCIIEVSRRAPHIQLRVVHIQVVGGQPSSQILVVPLTQQRCLGSHHIAVCSTKSPLVRCQSPSTLCITAGFDDMRLTRVAMLQKQLLKSILLPLAIFVLKP